MSEIDFDTELTRKQLTRILGISPNNFYDLINDGIVVESGKVDGRTKYYWGYLSLQNYVQSKGRQGKSTAASAERKEVQNSLDIAREETIQYELSVKRGETAPTATMREILSRALTISRNKISGIKPILRSKYEEVIDPQILDEIDSVCNSACADISNLELDDVFNLKDQIHDETD